MRRLLVGLVLGATLGANNGCGQVLRGGAAAAQAALPVSQAQEIAMGQAGVQQILSDPHNHLYTNPTINAYVTRVGMKMAAQTGRTGLPWKFYLLDSPKVNAFSLPGGFVFIYTGALKAMTNEAQLAGVLGHECGHVALRHGVEKLKQELLAQGILLSALGQSPQAEQVVGIVVATLVLNHYGRDEELQADTQGALYASRAGYDPHQLETFLEVLSKSGEPPAWLEPLQDHPSTAERVAHLQQVITTRHLTGTALGTVPFREALTPLSGGGAGR